MLATIRTFARVFFIGLAVAFSGSVAAAQINLANTANLPDDLYGSADDPLHITVGGNDFVFAVASGDFGVMGFSVASNGALTLVSETRQSDSALLGQPYALASAVVDGTTYLFVASRTDDVVNVYSVSDAGALTFVSSVVDNVTVNLDSVTDVAVAEVDGATYLLTVSSSDDGVSVFSVAADGALTNVHNVTDSGSLELNGAWGLATAEVGGTDFVFVSGVFDDGVSVFSLAANGTLTSTFNVPDSGSLELDAPWELTTVDVDGTTYLVVSGYNDDGLSVFSVAANGTLTNVHNVADDATLNLNGVREVSAIEIDGTVFLYAAGAIDSGVSVFSVAANGTLTNVSNVSDTDSIALSRANGVDTAMIDGSPFVFVTGETDGGITSFSAANDGSLSNVTTLADNLDIVLDRVYGLALAQIGGNDYLFSAAGNDDAVAVMSIGANGALTQVARAVDDATLNLDEARGVATSAIGGTTFLFAAAATDDGVSVFSVADNGALTNVFNIADSGSLELDGARTLTAANVGGTDLLFVGGYNDNGISVFTIAANGALASASDFPDNGTTSFDSPHSVSTTVVDGTTYLFVGGGSYYSGGLSVFSVASNGTLTNVENVSDSGSLNLRGDVSVTTAAIDGTTFLFAAGRLDSGVSVFSVAANGALTNVANLSDSAGRLINTTSGLSVFTYDGSTYLVVAGEWDDGFSVFSVAANGALTPVADIADDSTKLLDNLHALVSGTIDGMPYIFTGASLDDGISSFTVDNTAPLVASIDRQTPATSPTSDDSVTWRVTFNEQVTDIDASDFTRTGTTGTLSVSNVSSTAWDVTLSGGDMASLNATVTLAFAGGQNITDLAGNALSNITPSGANVTTFEMVNDVVAPRITSIVRNTPASSPTAADSVSWRVTFDEPVQNVTSGDFTISGTTGTLAVNNVSTTVTDVSLSGGDMASLDATVTLGFAGDQNIADLAGNALSNTTPTGTTQLSFDIDNTAPRIASIARQTPAASPTNADSVTWRMTFDEAVQNVDSADFSVTGTTATVTNAVSAGGNAFDVTVSGGDLANLNATITLGFDAGQTFEDLAGNALVDTTPTGANDNTFEILNDAVAPRIASITRQSPATSPTAADSVTWRVTFDEAVANVTADDFTVTGTNGTVSISAVSTSVTDVIVSGGDMASLNGTITLSLAGGQDIADLAGNALTDTSPSGANASTFEIDNSRPTLAITGPSGPVSGAFTATFLFSENVTGFSADDISVANGTAANVQATSASVYIATITPAADGAVSVNVAAAAQDAAGNNNLTAAQYSVENDETPPTVTAIVRQTPAASPTDADSLVWRVTFAEAVENIDAGDFTVTGTTATVEAVVDAGGNGVDVTVSGGDLSDLNGTATLGFAAGQDISDLAGNTLAGTTPTGTDESAWSVINDAEAPTVTAITRDNPAEQLTNADTLVWVVVFSEDVTDIDGADFALSGTTGTVTGVSEQAVALPPSANGSAQSQSFAVSSSSFVVTASGGDLANFNGEVALSFAAQQNITDAAGNALASTAPTGANDNIYTLDNTAPTVDLTIGEASQVSGPFTLTATFSEDVTGFDMSDLTVGNGTLSEFETVSPTVYTATITPGSGTNITVDVAAGAAADNAGNDNTAAAQLAIAHDTDRALTIAMPGVGSGTVSSDPAGIDCGSDCSADYTLGATVTLTAIADSGSSFAGWTAGPCSGTSAADCAVTIEADTTVAARFTLDAPPPGRIVASTLPAARSGYVGGPVITAFLSVVSRTSSPAQSCAVSAPAGAPVTLSYRQIDGSGAATGSENPVFDIASGGALSFVIAMTPTAETAAGGYEFMPVISCENASLDPIVGVNSVFLTIESVPTPDILSISATPSNDGVIRIPAPGATGFMVAAAVNIGAGDGSAGADEITLTTSVDTGDASLPVSAEVCQIDQTTAACITPRGASVTLIAAQNAPVFYAVFVRDTSTGGIAFDPANARVFLRFADASGTIRSATSAAVTAPAPAAEADIASSVPEGRWSVLVRQPEGIWPGLARASLFVMADGIAVIDDGRAVRRLEIAPAQSDTEGRGAFEALQLAGQWSTDGAIWLGAPWANTPGEFWGVRDVRPDRIVDWTAYSGSFGAGVYLTEAGEIRGSMAGCSVYGRAGEGFSTSLTLSGCDDAGVYTAVLDMPANESSAPALLIAGQEEGWRLER